MSPKNAKLYFWLAALCAGTICWLIVDLKSMSVYYDRFEQLTDPVTGAKRKPYDLYDLAKVINKTDEYINRTNAQERLYDLQYNLNMENPFMIDQSYTSREQLMISGWPVSNQTECGQNLGWILKSLNENKNYTFLRGQLGLELTRLMDGFGRPRSGLYSGQMIWLGSYENCKRSHLDGGRIKTRYCIAKLRFNWWPRDATQNVIRMGICIPETCDSTSFDNGAQKQAIDALLRFDMPDFYKNNMEFQSMFCLPDERSPIRRIPPAGHKFMLVLSLWLALVITASILNELRKKNFVKAYYIKNQISTNNPTKQHLTIQENPKQHHTATDQHQQQQQPRRMGSEESSLVGDLIECLSVRYSIKEFKKNAFRVRYNQGERVRVDLSVLDSIKILMAILVVLGHSAYLASLYSRSLQKRIEINTSQWGRLALSVVKCVDTFFFIFGVLTAYTLLRKFNTKQLANPFVWVGVNLGIMLRISPIFMLVFWYSKTISPYTGDGPWWDYGVHKYSMKGVCMSDPWWRSIPYFGFSQHLPAPACNLPGWFIVSYSQISLILPLITYLICKLPKYWLRCLLVAFISVLSVLQVAIRMNQQTSIRIEHIPLYGSFLVNLLEKFESIGFMSTFGRLAAVATGCLTGYLLRQYELGHIAQWPRWLSNKFLLFLVFTTHIVIICLPVIGYQIAIWTGHITTLNEFVYTNAVTSLLWPIINAIALINATTLYNNFVVVRFMSHTFWHIFNRLGLCIYLIHWEVLFFGMTNFEQAPSHGYVTDVMRMWSFGVFFSILLSFLIHVLVEAPISSLLNLLAKHVSEKFSFHIKRLDNSNTTSQ